MRNALSYLVPDTESIQLEWKNSIKANSKVFWSYVNGLKKSGELSSEMYFKDRKAKINQDIADLFSE